MRRNMPSKSSSSSYLKSIANIDDSYLRERTTDVKDAAQRLLENLTGMPGQQYDIPDDASPGGRGSLPGRFEHARRRQI